MAEDQRPAEKRVEANSPKAQPQDDAGPLERCDEVAKKLEDQPGSRAPHIGAHEALSLLGELGGLSERAHQDADVPKDEPVRRKRERKQPQAGAERPTDVTNGVGPPAKSVAIIGEEAVTRPSIKRLKVKVRLSASVAAASCVAPKRPISSTSVAWITC